MLKILIVDDEFYFRQALKISLPWEDLGFVICGEAKNGIDALEAIERVVPDIALVDINMPVMDGLEFIRTTVEKGYNIKFIILTGYGEFDYAKQAIEMGVQNYILKPINEEDLKNALFRIKCIIENEISITVELDTLKQKVKESVPILKEKFLNDLIQGHSIIRNEDISERLSYLDIKLLSKYYRVAVIEIDKTPEMNWNEYDKQLWKFAVRNITEEIIGGLFNYEMCDDNNGRTCVILGCNEIIDHDQVQIHLLFKSLKEAVSKFLKFTITIGLGNQYSELQDIHVSYKEAVFALKNKMVIGDNSIIFYNIISDSGLILNPYPVEIKTQLMMSMRMGNIEEICSLINQVFHQSRAKKIYYEVILALSIELIATCIEYLAETGYSCNDIFADPIKTIEEAQNKKNVTELEEWVKDIFTRTISFVSNNKLSRPKILVNQIKEFIHANYCKEDFRIEDIANQLYINYGHVCYTFKKEMGMTVIEYLTEVRIRKAKELIDSGVHTVNLVAEKVGYADSNYFGKCFKKYYGVSPKKYIENI